MNGRFLHSDAVVLPKEGGGHEVVPAAVRVVGTAIAEVVRGPAPEGAERVGGLLAPAFVNAHTHLAMSAYRGIGGLEILRGNVVEDLYFVIEKHLLPGDVRAFARMAALECLGAGVGTVWDHYYGGREVADACVDVGLGAVVAPTLQDLEGPGVPALDAQIDATLQMHGDAALAEAGVVAALGPHATDTVSGPLWGRLADLAARHGLPFHAHAAQSVEEYARARERHGVSPFAWLAREGWLSGPPTSLLVHGLYAHAGDLAGLDASRVVLGHCPASQMQYCFPAYTAGWRVAGFKMAVGTDCGACNDGMNVQQELRLISGGPMFSIAAGTAYGAFWHGGADRAADVARERSVRLAWSEQAPSALLATVWDTPGRLHPRLKVGRIEAGFRANLVAFDLEHPALWPGSDPLRALALQDVGPAIDRMMLNGRWLTASGEHGSLGRSPAAREAAREARARLDRLAARIGVSR